MDTVNEKTSAYLTVTFLDQAGAQQAPSAATWEVHDVQTRQAMKSATALTPAAVITITIEPAVNAIVDSRNPMETRRVTIKASYGASSTVNAEFDYGVMNLAHVT